MILFDVNDGERRTTLKFDQAGMSDLLLALFHTPEMYKGNETLMLEGALKGTISRWTREATQG